MMKPEAIAALKEAKASLQKALALLNRSKSECVHCKRTTYEEFVESQAGDNIEAVIRRIDNWIRGKKEKEAK